MAGLLARAERLLRWSEKFMRTDMVYLAKGGFWLGLSHAVSVATGLILVIGFANLLPKETYGSYRYVLSLAGVVAAFSLSGMGTAVTQAVARGLEGALRAAFRVQMRWSLLATLASVGLAGWYAVHGDRVLAAALLIVGAFTPVIESTSLYADYVSGKRDFRAGARYGILRSLVPAVALLATMALTDDLVVLVLAYFASHAAASATLYLRVLAKYRPAQEVDPSSVGFAKHVSVLNLISIAASYLDKILVFHFLGPVQLAAYGIAFSLPAQLKIVTKTVNTLAFPKLSAASLATIRSAIHQKALRMFLAFAAAVAAYVLAAPLIFRAIFPQYLEALPLSQVLALGYLFTPSVLYAQAFLAQQRHRENYANKLALAGIRVALLLALLPPFGLWGAVWAYVLGNALSFAVTLILFRRMRED